MSNCGSTDLTALKAYNTGLQCDVDEHKSTDISLVWGNRDVPEDP